MFDTMALGSKCKEDQRRLASREMRPENSCPVRDTLCPPLNRLGLEQSHRSCCCWWSNLTNLSPLLIHLLIGAYLLVVPSVAFSLPVEHSPTSSPPSSSLPSLSVGASLPETSIELARHRRQVFDFSSTSYQTSTSPGDNATLNTKLARRKFNKCIQMTIHANDMEKYMNTEWAPGKSKFDFPCTVRKAFFECIKQNTGADANTLSTNELKKLRFDKRDKRFKRYLKKIKQRLAQFLWETRTCIDIKA